MNTRDKTARTFLNKKPTEVLLAIRNLDFAKPSKVSRETGTIYTRVLEIIRDFESQGLVERSVENRDATLELTPMGEALAENFSDIDRKLRKWPGFTGTEAGATGR